MQPPTPPDLRKSNTFSQIRLAVPIAAALVSAAAAQRDGYSERIAVAVAMCAASHGSNAFENEVYRKSMLNNERHRQQHADLSHVGLSCASRVISIPMSLCSLNSIKNSLSAITVAQNLSPHALSAGRKQHDHGCLQQH